MSSEASDSHPQPDWILEQEDIAAKVTARDENNWSSFFATSKFEATRDLYVAGTDISFAAADADRAVGSLTIVVLRQNRNIDLVYSNSREVNVSHPYVSSFLGFREAPIVSELLRDLPIDVRGRLDCLLLDGNGMLHPRKAGLACHVGVRENLATIGVSKSLLCVDGLVEKEIRQLAASKPSEASEVRGASGTVWAKALLTGNAQNKPIYVSVGHKVSLETASRLVRQLCEFRIPAPIRAADLHSRAFLRGKKVSIYKTEAFLPTNPST